MDLTQVPNSTIKSLIDEKSPEPKIPVSIDKSHEAKDQLCRMTFDDGQPDEKLEYDLSVGKEGSDFKVIEKGIKVPT